MGCKNKQYFFAVADINKFYTFAPAFKSEKNYYN